MCTINLQTIMDNKSYPEAGHDLYNIITSKIDSENKIVIDLEGVVSLPSMFLNVSIGKFILEYGVDLLREKISFAQISTSQARRLQEYIAKMSEK